VARDQQVVEQNPRERGKIRRLITANILQAAGEEKINEAQNL
jgi:hypothetical protein